MFWNSHSWLRNEKYLMFVSLALDGFFTYGDKEMTSIKRESMQRILNFEEGNLDSQYNLEILIYVKVMQERYALFEVLNGGEVEEIHLSEVYYDDSLYYEVFFPKIILCSSHYCPLCYPSNEIQIRTLGGNGERMKVKHPLITSFLLEEKPFGGKMCRRDEDSCLMMDYPMIAKNSTNHEDVQRKNPPSTTLVLQED